MKTDILRIKDDNLSESGPSALLLASTRIRRCKCKYIDNGDEEDEEGEESGGGESS